MLRAISVPRDLPTFAVRGQYEQGWLAGQRVAGVRATDVEAVPGTVVEDVGTGWVGAVVRVEKAGGMHVVHLEDRRGRVRGFPLGPGFHLDGRPVNLTVPTAERRAQVQAAQQAAARTASGSVRVAGQPGLQLVEQHPAYMRLTRRHQIGETHDQVAI